MQPYLYPNPLASPSLLPSHPLSNSQTICPNPPIPSHYQPTLAFLCPSHSGPITPTPLWTHPQPAHTPMEGVFPLQISRKVPALQHDLGKNKSRDPHKGPGKALGCSFMDFYEDPCMVFQWTLQWSQESPCPSWRSAYLSMCVFMYVYYVFLLVWRYVCIYTCMYLCVYACLKHSLLYPSFLSLCHTTFNPHLYLTTILIPTIPAISPMFHPHLFSPLSHNLYQLLFLSPPHTLTPSPYHSNQPHSLLSKQVTSVV